MPARFNLYSAWIDPKFYGWAAVFAAALLLLIYAVRRYRGLGRAACSCDEPAHGPETEPNPFLEEPPARPAPDAAVASDPGQEEKTLVLAPGEQLAFLAAADAAGSEFAPQQEEPAAAPAAEPAPAEAPVPEPEPAPAPAAAPGHAAETFVRGIYAGINDLDERMKTIEAALSKGHVNADFTVKFLEDMVQDMDNLDKSKIKARLEYLLSDLKK
ncbi:MAG: hypothetical protein A2X32_08350 [Elusimicrobia bacterium GWC2_64_44]|nr:MAG: hypothetical protein A2X32_08350 [Elusimicrobia bacterium GWC2_64_44]